VTPTEIELATFRFVAQHLSQCATAVPEYDIHLFNTEVVLKMDVACSSEMLVSNDKTSPCHLSTEPQNFYSELILVNKLINLSCALITLRLVRFMRESGE